MKMKMKMNNHVRWRERGRRQNCRKIWVLKKKEEEDRLSSLPDDILTKILSCLPINSAATTSVLSTRWRHLWTGVTNFVALSEIGKNNGDEDDILFVQKLVKLTSLKLHNFHIELKSLSTFLRFNVIANIIRDQISCFYEVCSRDVENINIVCPDEGHSYFLFVPDFVFKTKSLVSLTLGFMHIMFDMPENVAIQLPNLKNLDLSFLSKIPPWLETLCRCSPLLEVLDLEFKLRDIEPRVANIFATNLKSLRIKSCYSVVRSQTHRNKFIIDAPKLEYLTIIDSSSSCYYLTQTPITLLEASLDLTRTRTAMVGDDDYRKDMAKFVRRMCNVSNNLHLRLDRNSNIISYLTCEVNHGVMFGKLATLKLDLEGIGLIVWKDLVLCLQCFPNLNNLEVHHYWLTNNDDVAVEHVSWYVPSHEPANCLVNKLKRIRICGLIGLTRELDLIAYLLSNATVLEKLEIGDRLCFIESKEDRLSLGNDLFNSLFDLPTASSTCVIWFATDDMIALSHEYKDGILRKQRRVLEL